MVYVLDTNIVLLLMGRPAFSAHFVQTYAPEQHDIVISAVSEGELRSLALQRGWGAPKQAQLNAILQQLIIYPVKVQRVINAYAEIDAYSQGRLAPQPLPAGLTARNMGKNDLWIAATTHVTGGTLLTTDQDFAHLAEVYFPLDLLDAWQFR